MILLWRDTGKTVRFFGVDGRAATGLILVLLHISLFTLRIINMELSQRSYRRVIEKEYSVSLRPTEVMKSPKKHSILPQSETNPPDVENLDFFITKKRRNAVIGIQLIEQELKAAEAMKQEIKAMKLLGVADMGELDEMRFTKQEIDVSLSLGRMTFFQVSG